MLYHIVAMARNRVIGKDNKLPWHFPADLKNFRALTTGSTVIMGRKTYESIGKPLPNRENFVLTRDAKQQAKMILETELKMHSNVKFFTSLQQALDHVKTGNAFIIGGAELYKQTINQVDGIYLTRIDADYEGDVSYPEIPKSFDEIEIQELQENPKIEVVFYERENAADQSRDTLPSAI